MNAAIMGNPDADPFYGAPTVLVVLADKSLPTHVYDGACVMCNLLNAAHAAGLDACWIHRAREEFDSEEGKALLKQWGVEGDLEGIGHCILGYRSGELQSAARTQGGLCDPCKMIRKKRPARRFCGARGVFGRTGYSVGAGASPGSGAGASGAAGGWGAFSFPRKEGSSMPAIWNISFIGGMDFISPETKPLWRFCRPCPRRNPRR